MNVDLYQIADEIAHDLHRPLDHALTVKIRSMLKEQRVFHMRRSIERARSIPDSYYQTFFTPTSKRVEAPYKSSTYACTTKTLEVIPTPMRIDFDSPFQDITSQDGGITFAHTKLTALKFNGITACTKNVPRYVYINGHIYTYFNRDAVVPIQGLLVTSVFDDPTLIRDYNNDANYYELNFPMPYELLSTIKQFIVQSMQQGTNDDKDITVDGTEQ